MSARWLGLVAILACALAAAPQLGGAQGRRRPDVHVSVGRRRLVIEPAGRERLEVVVTLGQRSREGAKRERGDLRTPRGTYFITRLRRSHPMLRRFALLGYPNDADAARARAAGLIRARVADEIRAAYLAHRTPPQDTALGGSVGIHGLGSVPYAGERLGAADLTEGCIAMSDADIDRVWPLLRIGTRVVIGD